MSKTKPVVLITGASTGLGLALVRLLLEKDQYHVVATARKSSMSRFADQGIVESESLWLRSLDVLKKSDRDALLDELNEKLGGVDILVNNAGYMLRAVVEHVGEGERFRQMDTNFRAPMALIKHVLPGMRNKHFGKIINVSSVAGMMAMPTMSVYSASKFALEAASESLWYEVKPWNIRVTLVQPGFVHSESYLNVKDSRECKKAASNKNSAYFYHYNSMAPFISRMMRWSPATPEKVAKTIYKVMRQNNPPLRVAATWDAHIFTILRRLLPRGIYHRLMYYSLPKVLRWGEE